MHSLNLVHPESVSLPQCFEENTCHASNGKHSCSGLFYPLKLQEHVCFKSTHAIDYSAQLVETSSRRYRKLRLDQCLR